MMSSEVVTSDNISNMEKEDINLNNCPSSSSDISKSCKERSIENYFRCADYICRSTKCLIMSLGYMSGIILRDCDCCHKQIKICTNYYSVTTTGKDVCFDLCKKCGKSDENKYSVNGENFNPKQYFEHLIYTNMHSNPKFTKNKKYLPETPLSRCKEVSLIRDLINLHTTVGIFMLSTESMLKNISEIHFIKLNEEDMTENQQKIAEFLDNHPSLYDPELFSNETIETISV
jgi:hypothetical protein